MVTDADNLGQMTKTELEEELRKAEDILDDVREERQFTLGQTGIHLGSHRLKTLRRRWERDEERLVERIGYIKSLLAR